MQDHIFTPRLFLLKDKVPLDEFARGFPAATNVRPSGVCDGHTLLCGGNYAVIVLVPACEGSRRFAMVFFGLRVARLTIDKKSHQCKRGCGLQADGQGSVRRLVAYASLLNTGVSLEVDRNSNDLARASRLPEERETADAGTALPIKTANEHRGNQLDTIWKYLTQDAGLLASSGAAWPLPTHYTVRSPLQARLWDCFSWLPYFEHGEQRLYRKQCNS